MENIFILLVAFQLKHFICDYPLQNEYMLNKMKNTDWINPLAAHCITHATFTGIIAFIYSKNIFLSLLLMLFDFICHFTMDRVKASPKILGRFKTDNKLFWWSLGFDQMIHHFTHYIIIAILIFYPFT